MKIKLTAEERATKKSLVGRRITRVYMHAFDPNRDGSRAISEHCTDPTIHLDDGSWIVFRTQETETGEYGIRIIHGGTGVKKK